MPRTHTYDVTLHWTGNLGSGTSSYQAYDRQHEVRSGTKPAILGSSDPAFRGNPQRWNPEELLVTSVAQCHMLWYLHLAAMEGIVVADYCDSPRGLMRENDDGSGSFINVTLRPAVTVVCETMLESALALHEQAGQKCFIARSVNFPVYHDATTVVASDDRRHNDRA